MRSRIATVVGTTVVATLFTITQASAITHEQDHATATTTTSSGPWTCTADAYTQVCFSPDGDWFHIQDREADGKSAVAEWTIENTIDGSATRWGDIWMTAGNNEWRYQNKDLPEASRLKIRTCHGDYEGHVVASCLNTLYVSTG
ncbi:hypothetical protein ACFYRK_31760 [Streptomyces sp. NPDC005381]|uniref:hypothetical protein n=1 Tax=Streptomyces sp. NPDC005381 TaxID=3364714 RepID=UPI0036A5F31D